MCGWVGASVCVCVCVGAGAGASVDFVCVCVHAGASVWCVCVCMHLVSMDKLLRFTNYLNYLLTICYSGYAEGSTRVGLHVFPAKGQCYTIMYYSFWCVCVGIYLFACMHVWVTMYA